ncbi:hemolysin III family channel protein [Corynebacterium sp. c8Ua_181]|uniref:Hemolysin III family channel protein n=1 Tax=Corynebacterium curieae TaxID=2913500 RepID=A0A9X3MDP1_9CORY|nr:hemolysin III family channel protein [Corynebacterium curieae]MCZ9307393.1 hemolysin III family channel protein [Corynebacterium curieae]MDV2424092.1 hemolysin III family channel protein [Corynebacterium curieae]
MTAARQYEIATVACLVLGAISSVIAMLMLPALFHEFSPLRLEILTGTLIFGVGMLLLARRCAPHALGR